MKMVTTLVFLFVIATVGSATLTRAQEPTPRPDSPPVGEFSVVPASGPIGTVVTLTGHVDQPITSIRFWCLWRVESFVEALSDLSLSQPASDFSIEFEIPAELSVRQPRPGEDATIEPRPEAECSFRAISWHQLLFASVPFTVTEPGTLPSTGLAQSPDGLARELLMAVSLAIGGLALLALGRLWLAR